MERAYTFRLWKHMLRAGGGVGKGIGSDPFTYHTYGSFVGREIVWYAEYHAVYTICVVARDVFGEIGFNSGHDAARHHVDRQYLLLRLISWNTKVALDRNFGEKVETHCGTSNDDRLG